jgi:hypothetical protein
MRTRSILTRFARLVLRTGAMAALAGLLMALAGAA